MCEVAPVCLRIKVMQYFINDSLKLYDRIFFSSLIENESVPKSRNYLIKILICCGWLILAGCQMYIKLLYHSLLSSMRVGARK